MMFHEIPKLSQNTVDVLRLLCNWPRSTFNLPVCGFPGESFWEVAPDLADSPAAAWAMSGAFPAELKPLFVECFGVREASGREWK